MPPNTNVSSQPAIIMNAPATTLLIVFAAIQYTYTSTSLASERSSANYSITADVTDTGGHEVTSTNYTNIGSAGLIAGTTDSATGTVNKSGYIAQLYTIQGLSIEPALSNVNEGGDCQLSGYANLDDGSFLALEPTTITWGIVSGPVTQISNSGNAATGNVYQNTTAQVEATWQSYQAQTSFNVLNVGDDDFGIYAGDNVDDSWQVTHFGEGNPLAVGNLDPDGDGDNNWKEFLTGNIPTDISSIFRPASTFDGATMTLTIPTIAGRTYTVKTSSTLADWDPYTTFTGDGSDKVVEITDLGGTELLFYTVGVSKN